MKQSKTIRGGAVAASAVLLIALINALVPSGATATHSPADKVVAAGSKVEKFSPGTNVTLMTARMKTSKPTDLILNVAMECSIITNNVIVGGAAATGSAETQGTVRVWVEIDNQIVPIISSSQPPQNPPPPGSDSDKVTFCNRVFNRTVTDMENPKDGIDGSADYIATKAANSFNWLRLNMGSGDHTIVVKAEMTHLATAGSIASAYVGNRSLIASPAKLANDAVINEGGS